MWLAETRPDAAGRVDVVAPTGIPITVTCQIAAGPEAVWKGVVPAEGRADLEIVL